MHKVLIAILAISMTNHLFAGGALEEEQLLRRGVYVKSVQDPGGGRYETHVYSDNEVEFYQKLDVSNQDLLVVADVSRPTFCYIHEKGKMIFEVGGMISTDIRSVKLLKRYTVCDKFFKEYRALVEQGRISTLIQPEFLRRLWLKSVFKIAKKKALDRE